MKIFNYKAFLFIFFTVCANSSTSKEELNAQKCQSAFGLYIGQSYLTKAYSNCNGDFIFNDLNFVIPNNLSRKIKSGLKWQCVEYARRWLIENKRITFEDVEYAYQIWDLKYGSRVDVDLQTPLIQFKNKTAKTAPQLGDLLIYSTEFAITGHVAVIVEVGSNFLKVAEQNYFNLPWDGIDYSRRLLLSQDEEGKYRIFDDSLIGWVRFDG